MENKYFNRKDTIFDITEKYSEAIELLASLGLQNLKDENMRKTFGKTISLEDALKLKKINTEVFEAELIEKIENNQDSHQNVSDKKNTIKVVGVLPCPVRVPLTEAFENWLANQSFDYNLEYELKAASMGIGWLKDALINQSKEELPDIFVSAGFDLFFDKKLFGKYKSDDIFEDITGFNQYNTDFHNEYIQLEDPNKQYSMIGVVPAVFLINTEELKDRKMPASWEDILKEEFRNSVSLPIADFDLFNSILLNIYKNYGEDGVKKLGMSLQRSMHPSEMVKSHMKKNDKPVVTIMPYFFTKMMKEGGPMVPVWPKDGAIISPIFLLSKKDKKEELKPIVDFLASTQVGEILSHNGKFPSVNPKVDNRVPKENKYMWLGWDFIKEHDITSLYKQCENIFNSAIGDEKE